MKELAPGFGGPAPTVTARPDSGQEIAGEAIGSSLALQAAANGKPSRLWRTATAQKSNRAVGRARGRVVFRCFEVSRPFRISFNAAPRAQQKGELVYKVAP